MQRSASSSYGIQAFQTLRRLRKPMLFPYCVCVCVCVCARAHVRVQVCSVMSNSVTIWTIAGQAPLSMKFSRQEYWSGLPSPLPGALPDPGIELTSLASPALAGGFFITVPPGKPSLIVPGCKESWCLVKDKRGKSSS